MSWDYTEHTKHIFNIIIRISYPVGKLWVVQVHIVEYQFFIIGE